ncbi:MAG TPA: trypsin-like peptidase domain-containing protein [Pyrinomonadaceae bacterium]|nr:trypsin-like peptidase domain-containing protein [Pyrinomonadaceae bacterium]
MATGLVVHVELGDNKQTDVLTQERVRIGSCDDCDVRLRPPYLLAADNLLVELAATNGHFRVSDFNRSLRITHNGSPLAEGAVVSDGDEVRVESSGLALRFFPLRGEVPALVGSPRQNVQVAPFVERAAVEAAATARRDDAKVFLREFTRELVREINLSTKIIAMLIAVALVGGVLYIGHSAYRELESSRELIRQQNEQMARLKETLDQTQNRFEEVRASNNEIIDSLSLAPTLHGKFGNGVCLITGSYILVDAATNLPLRYPQLQTTEDGTPLQTGDEQPVLTPEGNGAIYINDYEGTGFHVGGGYILTNRHLALEPWVADERAQSLSASVRGKFRLTRLVAFFPDRRQAFVLRFKAAAAKDDLAVTLIEGQEIPADLPVLPLDRSLETAAIGRKVVMIGFPRGADRLMATYLPENESRALQTRFGSSAESLLAALAERNLIKPRTTEGTITDLQDHRIGYDASSAEGGSGAPIFGPSGRVIGLNFGSYIYMPNANFGIPIRHAFAPLDRAGWKSPEPPADPSAPNANANANTSKDKDPRANPSPSNKPPAPR